MEAFQVASKFPDPFLRDECERTVMNDVLQKIKKLLGEEQPEAKQVRAYLKLPGR